MIYLHSSAWLAMLTGEGDADRLADRLEQDRIRYYSAITVWEVAAGLHRAAGVLVPQAQELARDFAAHAGLKSVPIDDRERELAIQAHALFGEGHHLASLSMADCFEYACAKAHRAALLFTDIRFNLTDVLRAV